MRSSSLASGGKNRFGVRRKSWPLCAQVLHWVQPKLAMGYRKFLYQKAGSKRATVVARVELRCRRTLSPGGIHLNEQDTKRRAVHDLMTTAAEGSGTRIRTESFDPDCPGSGNPW